MRDYIDGRITREPIFRRRIKNFALCVWYYYPQLQRRDIGFISKLITFVQTSISLFNNISIQCIGYISHYICVLI